MKKITVHEKRRTTSEQETVAFGKEFSDQLRSGDMVLFYGGLGCGKTAMIRGIGEGLGINPSLINSPTFVLLNQYQGSLHGEPVVVNHFDFYRLGSVAEIVGMGFDDYQNDDGAVCLVEWAERLESSVSGPYWRIKMQMDSSGARLIEAERFHER